LIISGVGKGIHLAEVKCPWTPKLTYTFYPFF